MDFSYHTLPFTFKFYAFCKTELCEKVQSRAQDFILNLRRKQFTT